ncbi:XkdX family protein [Marinicrinis lubricantis]|uniref:XkdX family protein n=1 Tax=Marinicrinis lubricantis TaxID=2086470 RepID=A0ABW1IIR3_9BACL
MNWFALIQRYYILGCYTIEHVKTYCDIGKITKDEYETITGEPYPIEAV